MAPQPALRPGPVDKESAASGPLHHLQSELTAAKVPWDQLGKKIAKGYTAAYDMHLKTLKDMEDAKKKALSNDALIFVLSIISVGFAGGLVGGLVAPWVDKAGSSVARKALRAGVTGVGTQAVQTITDAGIKKAWEVDVPSAPYKPRVPKEIAVDQDIEDRINSAFGPVLEAVDAMIATANKIDAPIEAGQAVLNNFRKSCPLLTDKPAQSSMPSEKQAADAAELAMWVIWANGQDWTFWNSVYKAMDIGWNRAMSALSQHDYVKAADYARDIDPIGNRLAEFGQWLQTLSVVRYTVPGTNRHDDTENILYTDLRKLRILKLDDATLPFQRLSGLQFQWNKLQPLDRATFLTKMEDVKPIYVK